jgi:hypothetical protein
MIYKKIKITYGEICTKIINNHQFKPISTKKLKIKKIN